MRAPSKTFEDLLVWQKAHRFVLDIYALTTGFPKQETYGLSLQMRRAAVSIPANIAEGFGRYGHKEFARFLVIARGSLFETQNHLQHAHDVGYLTEEQFLQLRRLSARASRAMSGLLTYLRRNPAPQDLDDRRAKSGERKPPHTRRT